MADVQVFNTEGSEIGKSKRENSEDLEGEKLKESNFASESQDFKEFPLKRRQLVFFLFMMTGMF